MFSDYMTGWLVDKARLKRSWRFCIETMEYSVRDVFEEFQQRATVRIAFVSTASGQQTKPMGGGLLHRLKYVCGCSNIALLFWPRILRVRLCPGFFLRFTDHPEMVVQYGLFSFPWG
jgi:hypothetical protein